MPALLPGVSMTSVRLWLKISVYEMNGRSIIRTVGRLLVQMQLVYS